MMTKNHRAKQRRRAAAAARGVSYSTMRRSQQAASAASFPSGSTHVIGHESMAELLAVYLTGRGLAAAPMSASALRVLGGYCVDLDVIGPEEPGGSADTDGSPAMVRVVFRDAAPVPALTAKDFGPWPVVAEAIPVIGQAVLEEAQTWVRTLRTLVGLKATALCLGCGTVLPRGHLLRIDDLPLQARWDALPLWQGSGTPWPEDSEVAAMCAACVFDDLPFQPFLGARASVSLGAGSLYASALWMLDRPDADPRWAAVAALASVGVEDDGESRRNRWARVDGDLLSGAPEDLWDDRWARAASGLVEVAGRDVLDPLRYPFSRAAVQATMTKRNREWETHHAHSNMRDGQWSLNGGLHTLSKAERAVLHEATASLVVRADLPLLACNEDLAEFEDVLWSEFTLPAASIPVHLPHAQWLREHCASTDVAEALIALDEVCTIPALVRAVDRGAPGLMATWFASLIETIAMERIDSDETGEYLPFAQIFPGHDASLMWAYDHTALRQCVYDRVAHYLGGSNTTETVPPGSRSALDAYAHALVVARIDGWIKRAWGALLKLWPAMLTTAVTDATSHSDFGPDGPMEYPPVDGDFVDSPLGAAISGGIHDPEDLGFVHHAWLQRGLIAALLFPHAFVTTGEESGSRWLQSIDPRLATPILDAP